MNGYSILASCSMYVAIIAAGFKGNKGNITDSCFSTSTILVHVHKLAQTNFESALHNINNC